MKECDELVGMKTVSIPESSRFIWAICNSFSKSETTRSPRTITSAPRSGPPRRRACDMDDEADIAPDG